MPGILVMNDHASNGPAGPKDGENRKRNHDGQLINGHAQNLQNVAGQSSKAVQNSLAVSGPATPNIAPDQLSELPPEIVHISEDAYHSLSTLLLRTSQQTYNDLLELLQTMSEMPVAQQTNGVLPNGTGPHAGNQANAEVNKRKKAALMKFAFDNRAKFVKLLVLTEWGKNKAKEVAQLIDLFAWAREQQSHADFVDTQLERIKVFSNSAAEKNPDITTALEILSTGKAPWMPTLGYVPPDPISSDKALKLLRYMNTSLSIRLNVHENLPRRLRNWRIQSGRATFVIDKELEFDLVSFVEDTSEQWFFIDMRILFSPAPTITVGSQFFARLKHQADIILRDKGLPDLYDHLQNFVLTHKISVLRSQAVALARSGWSGSLKVEPVHRELVVSYWTGRPGKKNWIEIGVSINKPKNGKQSWRGPPTPSLNVRWFRQGRPVKDANLKFDWSEISFEKVIKHVIALHISDILRTTRTHLDSKITASAALSAVEPTDCRLQVTLGPASNATTLSLESVTGNYILQPANAVSARAESAFNQGREPQQIAFILTQALAQTLRELVHKFAQQLGWHTVAKPALRFDAFKSAVKLEVLQYALYAPRGWSAGWALAVVIDASGASWWIIQTDSNGLIIKYAEQITMHRPDGSSICIDRMTLASLERVAVQLLSTRVTTRKLEEQKKAFNLQSEYTQITKSSGSPRIARGWVLYLRTADLLESEMGDQSWLESNIAIVCQGLQPGGRNVWHIATGKMVKDVAADMQKLMAASHQNGFKLSEDGHFRILLSVPFGQDILGDLRTKLRAVNRLRTFATTLQKRKMRLGSSSLDRVQFQYGPSPLVAAVNFSSEKEVSIEIQPNNPHYRVRKLLLEIANGRTPCFSTTYFKDSNGLDRFCTALVLTRPVITVLRKLELQSGNGNLRNPAIHAHSVFKYRLTYENPVCTFDIRAQSKDDRVVWFVEDNYKQHSQELRPSQERQGQRRLENLQAKLKELFAGRGGRWFGTRNGIIAAIDGIPEALKKLNEVVLSCKMEGGYKPPPPLEPSVPQSQSHGQGQPQQQQKQPQQNGVPTNNQQARMQQARQQQMLQQQQAQNQARKQQQQQQGARGQMPNGRPQGHPQQHMQQQMKMGGRMGGQQQGKKDIIEID